MQKKPFSLSRKTVAWLSLAALLISLLPLYAIAIYNHPFYDDFGFSLLTHDAWRETGRVTEVLAAAWRNMVGTHQTWQGRYTASFISSMQPAIFGEGHYWITTFLLLTSFLAALGFFLWQMLRKALRVDLSTFSIIFASLAFLMVQFLPDVTEAFFWFNGGVGYTLFHSLMLLAAGLWLRFEWSQSKIKSMILLISLMVFIVLLGGGSYSMLLFFSLCALLFVVWSFWKKRPKKWLHLGLFLLLLGCFAFNMAAPGNAVRAKTLQGGMSAPMAILQSFYFGFALMGNWFSLPLIAVLCLIAQLLLPTLRQSSFAFPRPLWLTLLAGGLFCAQLAPTLFTGTFLGDGRILDIYYFTYVLMICGIVLYWTGWLARKTKTNAAPPVPSLTRKAPRLHGGFLAVLAVLLIVGCISYHPDGTESYGPQNMPSGSAALSLIRGEAAQYDREMSARDAALNDPSQPNVELTSITVIPNVFMSDILQSRSLDYALSLYADYYEKASVTVAEKGD